jgi:hypothetical protein
MAQVTLREAERLTGVGRTALQKAISRGRISASKDDLGQWRIDVSELTRVYPPMSEPLSEGGGQVQGVGQPDLEVLHLRDKLAMVENERDYLRNALEQERELLFRLSLPRQEPDTGSDKSKPAIRTWVWVLLAALVAAVSGLAVVVLKGW